MSQKEIINERFWRGLLLSFATHGNAHINTNGNAHHRAFRPVAKAFARMQDRGMPYPDFPTRIYASPITHQYLQLDVGLIDLWRIGLADYTPREGVVQINPRFAKKILSNPKLYSPFEQTALGELARKFSKYHVAP
jgi:hypothetical protein